MSSGAQQPKHHFRFYLVMTTVVIAGIFVLLLLNEGGEGGFGLLTSSAVRELGAGDVGHATTEEDASADETERIFGENLQKSPKEVEVKVSFDQIPNIKKEAKIEEMELKFDDLTTKISVNNDKLELNNLKEVSLKINGFEGKMDLDGAGVSLGGTVRRLEVNGIAISSKSEIKLAFNDLDYRSLTISQIELPEIELPMGDGTLGVADKLSYALEQDELTLYYFDGELSVLRSTQTDLNLEGVAKGMSVSGSLLDFNLK